jgi:hypothetical protein
LKLPGAAPFRELRTQGIRVNLNDAVSYIQP